MMMQPKKTLSTLSPNANADVSTTTTMNKPLITPQRQNKNNLTSPMSLRSLGLTPDTSVIPSPYPVDKRKRKKYTDFMSGFKSPISTKNLTPMKEIINMHYTERWVELAKYGYKFLDGKYILPETKITYDKTDKSGKSYEYIAVYVDDLAIAMENPQEFISVLQQKYGFQCNEMQWNAMKRNETQ